MAQHSSSGADTSAGTNERPGTERPNKVTISDAGPSRKRLSIEIPAETVGEHLETSLSTLITEADIPGFRRGRAPRRLVERKFGSVVRREARTQLVSQAFQQAVEENKLRVIGEPDIPGLDKLELVDGSPLAFAVEVEVAPEFEVPSLDGMSVDKPTLEVTDKLVDDEIRTMSLHEGDLEPQEAPAPGDYLTGRGVMRAADEAGKVFLDITDAVIQCPPPERNGKGMILGVMVEDFESQLGLPKPGETATIRTKGPEGHETEELRGRDLVIEFTVSRVDRIIPAKPQALAERFGLRDEAELREAVRARMRQRIAVDQQSAMRNQVALQLVEKVTMDLPERLTAAQAQRTLNRQRLELMHRGFTPDKIEERIAELRAATAEAAVRELKLMFILERAAEQLGVRVSEGEVNGQIARMAASRNERPERLKQELQRTNQIGTLVQQIREHKTLDAIISRAQVREKPVEQPA